jgi:AcrR family transcriptional regulator
MHATTTPDRDDGTRARVLGAAADVLERDPAATMAQLAAAAGVSRATVHRHFRTRADLLAALDVEPETDTRDRVLAAAADLVGRAGLATLSMDDVAARAGVSRASVYRLFPGKAALFEALITTYSPFRPVVDRLEQIRDRPPEEVVPEIYRLAAPIAAANIGILRAVFTEVTAGSPDAIAGAGRPILGMVRALGGYLAQQMAAGRIRRMDPTLAVQAVFGPLVFHILTRPYAKQIAGLDVPLPEAVEHLSAVALAGLQAPSRDDGHDQGVTR